MNVSFAFKTQIEICLKINAFKTRNVGCVLRFKRKRKITNAKIYEDKRDLYCTNMFIKYCIDSKYKSILTVVMSCPAVVTASVVVSGRVVGSS